MIKKGNEKEHAIITDDHNRHIVVKCPFGKPATNMKKIN
jgi:hypothetical protein